MAPSWAEALLRRLAPPGRADDVLGDLNEMHHRRCHRSGRLVANTLTAFETLDMAVALVRQKIRQNKPINKSTNRNRSGDLLGPEPGLSGYGTRNSWRWHMLRAVEAWTRDFIHAARSLQRAPGFTLVTVLTLALAIGANTAIFSVVNTVLLDPLDFPDADRLVSIRSSAPGSDLPEEFGPGPEFYLQYRENADLLEDLGIHRSGQTTVRSEDQTERLFVTRATPSLFTTLGVNPALGRLPSVEDPSDQVALISHSLWENWFGADPEIIGRAYEVSGAMRTVIGVMEEGFRFPDDRISVWIHSMFVDPEEVRVGNFGFSLVGRMKPDIQHADLTSQLSVLASRLPELYGGPPQYARIIEQHRPIVRSLEEELVGDFTSPLWLLLGTVGIVLLIACANVANLFTVRAESRRRDLAVRQALGAGRAGMVRVQMAEALLLGVVGGAAGAIIAWVSLPLLVRAAPENIPNLAATRLDTAALVFTAGVSILSACVFGLIPAIRFSKPQFVGALRKTGIGGDTGGHLTRDALVLVQTAAALVLLVGSGLLIRSFWTLTRVDPGYDTQNIFSFQVAPDREELNDGPSFAQFHTEFMERVSGLPSVESVGLTLALPLDEGAAGRTRFNTTRTLVSGDAPAPMPFTSVGGDYFQTMGITLERGRRFESSDHTVGQTKAIISNAASKLLFPDEDPLGRRLYPTADTALALTVVGVVEDIFLQDFRQEAADPMVYLPMVGPTARTWAVGSPAYVVKSARAEMLAPEIRSLMREFVPESPMYRVFTMEGLAARSMAELTFTMLMLAIASGLSLILGAVGLYGVLSYVVARRGQEIAVRMALGAEAQRVRRMVVMEGARVTLVGVAVGLVAALGLTRVLETMLFGVGKLDVLTFVVMSGVMVAVAFLASYLPARRASSVDPMRSLRTE